MKRTDQIDRISRISVASLRDSWVLVDSDELNLTGKMRLSEFIDLLSSGVNPRAFKFANGNMVAFSNGNQPRIAG